MAHTEKSRARLRALMERVDTARIHNTTADYSVFEVQLQREAFEALADALAREYRVSFGYKPLGAKRAAGRWYAYVIVVEEQDSAPVPFPSWLRAWAARD